MKHSCPHGHVFGGYGAQWEWPCEECKNGVDCKKFTQEQQERELRRKDYVVVDCDGNPK